MSIIPRRFSAVRAHLTAVFVAAVTAPLLSIPIGANASVDVIKSPNDSREYRALTLENGLRVMLVHDADTDQAAASLDVPIGSGSDPYNRQGLAHFLEHMLFLGTEKYPQPGEYHKFINDHGGQNNAYTSFDHTNYFFSVEPAFLEPALDRFAQFFIAPLFNEEFVQRERTVVHSEYTGKKKEAGRRWWSAFKESINPAHPMRKFSVGSLSTLADRTGGDIRDELVRFYESHYSSNIMTLSVVGNQSLDELESWVTDKFSAIKNRELSRQQFDIALFEADELPRELRVKPLRDQRSLTLTFPLFSLRDFWASKPAGYISNIVGHEGENSLLSLLKSRGWVESLSAGQGTSTHTTSTIQITMELSTEGVKHVDEIIGLSLRMIDLVKSQGIQRWLFEEARTLADIAFEFQEESSAAGLARSLAARLHDYPAEDVLRAGYAYDEFTPDIIRMVLSHLHAENMLVTFTAPAVETDRKTVWFDTDYALEPITEERLRAWAAVEAPQALQLPDANPFIPTNTDLLTGDGIDKPMLIVDEPGFEAWHDLDTEFAVPKAGIYFSVRSPEAHNSPEHAILSDIFVRMLNEQLNEFSYPASLAGLDYSLYAHMRGFTTRMNGYADSQDKLLARIIEAVNAPEFDTQRFERARAALERSLRNATDDAPYEQILDENHRLVMSALFSRQSMIEAAQSVDMAALQTFVSELLDEIDVALLIHGNVDKTQASSIASTVRNGLLRNREPAEVAGASVVNLDPGANYTRRLDVDHDDSAISIYLQGDSQDVQTRALFTLLGQVIQSPFYEQIRTREELGYYVFASPMTVLDVPAIGFTVQSPTTGPATLDSRIAAFIDSFVPTLAAMPESAFERHKAALNARITEKETNITQRTGRYWRELDRRKLNFDSREQLAEAVKAITLAEFTAFAEAVLTSDARKRLVVYATGANHRSGDDPADELGGEVVSDANAFKRGRSFFPSVQTSDES